MSCIKSKSIYIIIRVLIFIAMLFILTFPSYGSDERPKEIYVVYDTSGSMLGKNEVSDYPWHETGYALELLVAMMEKDDAAHVYFMDDDTFYSEETYHYNGQEELHEKLKRIAYTKYTYVDGVIKAIEDLKANENNSEKFLVILSDGKFNKKGNNGNYTFSYKDEIEKPMESVDAQIIYLALSKEAESQLDHRDGHKTNVFSVTERGRQTSGNARIFNVFTDMGNLIYDRRILNYEDIGGADGSRQIEFTADLPMRRLIVLCQSETYQDDGDGKIRVVFKETGEELTNISGDKKISGIKAEELEMEKEGWAHYKRSKGEAINEGNYAGGYSIFTGAQGKSAKAGRYCLQVPGGTNVDIFVEYEIEYRILMKNGEEEWELLSREDCLEGEYELKVQLIDTQRNAPILADAKIYDDLNINVAVENQEEPRQIAESRDWKLHLSEGTARIRVTSQLKGNAPVEQEQDLAVSYRVKNPDIHVKMPDGGMDVDKLGEKDQEKIHVTVTENGRDISDYVEVSVNAREMTDAKYQYTCEKNGTEWLIWPEKNGDPVLEADQLVISVTPKNGKEESWTEKIAVYYYVKPKSFGFQVINGEPKDIFGFYRQGITIVPTLDGKPVELLKNGIGENVEDALKESSDGIEMERISGQTVIYKITFKCLTINWHLLGGGEVHGKIKVIGERYGQEISGTLLLNVEILPVRMWIILLALFVAYVFLVSIAKRIFAYNFFSGSLEVMFWRDFSGNTLSDEIEHINRRWIRNLIHPFNSEIVVPLENTGWQKASELVIRQKAGGKLWIKNAKELMDTGEVFVGNEKVTFDMQFGLDEGIELMIQTDNPIRLLIRRKNAE